MKILLFTRLQPLNKDALYIVCTTRRKSTKLISKFIFRMGYLCIFPQREWGEYILTALTYRLSMLDTSNASLPFQIID